MQEMFDPADYPDLLVGLQSPDDAAVWKLDENRSLVLTTDFFTPVVDDPFDYGRIAAANSFSDVYAMGGNPFLALNIAAIPPDLDPQVTRTIFSGGAEIARKAGVVVAGGHSIQDKEPKYGMVVAGFVETGRMFTKSGARPGDQLYLTKPLGFGTITTALKQQKADERDVAAAVRWMVTLNRYASEAARECDLKGATDITGYSLLGHASEMALASGVAMRFSLENIPILENAIPYAEKFIFPGGTFDNREHFSRQVSWQVEVPEYRKMLLFDAQTSGGLLVAVPEIHAASFEEKMKAGNRAFWRVGDVTEGQGIIIL